MMLGENLRRILCVCRYEIVYTKTMPLPYNVATSDASQLITPGHYFVKPALLSRYHVLCMSSRLSYTSRMYLNPLTCSTHKETSVHGIPLPKPLPRAPNHSPSQISFFTISRQSTLLSNNQHSSPNKSSSYSPIRWLDPNTQQFNLTLLPHNNMAARDPPS